MSGIYKRFNKGSSFIKLLFLFPVYFFSYAEDGLVSNDGKARVIQPKLSCFSALAG